ncbi:MAG: hypothetical protein O4859_05320 [Trichodesmium sp. St18_bin1]|nr:hypothetical protein [Trichodesmium sp. St18_bin1]
MGSVDWFIAIGKCIYSHGVRVVPKIPKSKGSDLLAVLPIDLIPRLVLLAIALCALFTAI